MLRQLIFILILGFGVETITVMARLFLDESSAKTQRQLQIPRLHRSYLGLVLIFFYFLWHQQWLLISGGALVFSDALHHFAIIPFLLKNHYDLESTNHPRIHKLIKQHRRSIAIIFIVVGFIALVTPLTPGSWLIPMGLIMLVGRARTKSILSKVVGWRSKKIIELIPKNPK